MNEGVDRVVGKFGQKNCCQGPLSDRKMNECLMLSHRTTIPENLVKIGPVDSEIIG